MGDLLLQGYRVLVVEDEYLIAKELCGELELAGAEVIGPIGHLATALAQISEESDIHAAVLDVNLRGNDVFSLADLLVERGVPLVFYTGYDNAALRAGYAGSSVCLKPVSLDVLIREVHKAVKA